MYRQNCLWIGPSLVWAVILVFLMDDLMSYPGNHWRTFDTGLERPLVLGLGCVTVAVGIASAAAAAASVRSEKYALAIAVVALFAADLVLAFWAVQLILD